MRQYHSWIPYSDLQEIVWRILHTNLRWMITNLKQISTNKRLNYFFCEVFCKETFILKFPLSLFCIQIIIFSLNASLSLLLLLTLTLKKILFEFNKVIIIWANTIRQPSAHMEFNIIHPTMQNWIPELNQKRLLIIEANLKKANN